MSKGSWDRSNLQKVQESEYWKPENVEKRKAIAKSRLPYQLISHAKFDQLKQDVIKLHSPD